MHVQVLRADVQVPSRKQLASTILDQKHLELTAHLRAALKNQAVCLSTDGFTNVNHESVVNYLVTSQGKSFYLESVNTGTQGHSAEWMAADIERILLSYHDTNVVGMVTDNTSANKAAWRLLSAKFPQKFFYGTITVQLHRHHFF